MRAYGHIPAGAADPMTHTNLPLSHAGLKTAPLSQQSMVWSPQALCGTQHHRAVVRFDHEDAVATPAAEAM